MTTDEMVKDVLAWALEQDNAATVEGALRLVPAILAG